jgi:beta-glucosidase
MQAGYEAQLRSIVMLKNRAGQLPVQKQMRVYIPQRYVPAGSSWFGIETPERWEDAFNREIAGKYYRVVDNPEEADFALVGISSPDGGVGYDRQDREKGGNGYIPISLQYRPYTAVEARDPSIAGGSPFESFTNRTFRNKTVSTNNSKDLDLVTATRNKMGEKPVIVIVNTSKPLVFSEIEPFADGILIHMGVQDQALMDMVSGDSEPSALLPFQMPAHMATVEQQSEDLPRDMECYRDTEGHTYDFAFGMNWEGVIDDARVTRYK